MSFDKEDGGLGMLLREKQLADDRVVVFVKTMKAGGSADHSGKIEANDVITHVNGEAVINNRAKDVTDMVRGGVKWCGGERWRAEGAGVGDRMEMGVRGWGKDAGEKASFSIDLGCG